MDTNMINYECKYFMASCYQDDQGMFLRVFYDYDNNNTHKYYDIPVTTNFPFVENTIYRFFILSNDNNYLYVNNNYTDYYFYRDLTYDENYRESEEYDSEDYYFRVNY